MESKYEKKFMRQVRIYREHGVRTLVIDEGMPSANGMIPAIVPEDQDDEQERAWEGRMCLSPIQAHMAHRV